MEENNVKKNEEEIAKPSENKNTKNTNGFAIAALVCGILGAIGGFIIYLDYVAWILGILGIVFGAIGMKKAKERGSGYGLAVAGLTLGIVGTVIAFICFIVVLLVVAGLLASYI